MAAGAMPDVVVAMMAWLSGHPRVGARAPPRVVTQLQVRHSCRASDDHGLRMDMRRLHRRGVVRLFERPHGQDCVLMMPSDYARLAARCIRSGAPAPMRPVLLRFVRAVATTWIDNPVSVQWLLDAMGPRPTDVHVDGDVGADGAGVGDASGGATPCTQQHLE